MTDATGPGAASSSAYHHGDTRNALIAAALALEPVHGPLGVSLREAARQLGITHAAAYHYFASKEALVVAIAEQGFDAVTVALDHAIDHAIDRACDPFAAVIAAASAYARFAVREPSQFRFMYGTSPASAAPLAAYHGAILIRFERVVVAAQGIELIAPGAPTRPAAQLWGATHGIATLTLAGALDGAPAARHDKRSAKQTERRTLDLVRATVVGLLMGMAPAGSRWRAMVRNDL